ncbi:MAG TPA: glycosyltransferase [Mycobacteriales bacterium]|jgi:hypothetical protein|nr:glycosyltransferase [Mycobacteriales bacterium]
MTTGPGRTRRVVVYDPDGINPYGREIAAQLAARGLAVTAVVPGDAEWRPRGVRTLAVLPHNRSGAGGVARQSFRLLRGLLTVLRLALANDAAWLVAWTRTPHEEAVLALVARLRRVHVVVHNPGARDVRRRTLRWLRAAAASRVVHSASLATGGEVVARHPLYTEWLRWSAPGERPPHDGLRLLVLGAQRPDKGGAALPALLDALTPGVTVVACGKGPLDPALRGRVEDRTAADFVRDRDLAAALMSCDALLAPYAGATQSGTVALAVTAGLGVLGYDSGAVAELAGRDGLVPPGDTAALLDRIARAARGDLPAPAADGATDDWLRVVSA